jgi:hypothetical protein
LFFGGFGLGLVLVGGGWVWFCPRFLMSVEVRVSHSKSFRVAFRSEGWVMSLPLTEVVSFNALLQKGNRVQVPKLVRWQFKMEPTQVLRVTVKVEASHFTSASESFYARMSGDGRITVPLLTLALLQKRRDADEGLVGCVFEVKIEPAEGSNKNMAKQ